MTDSDSDPHSTVDHRSYYSADGDEITLRDDIDGEDGVFELRMPIASTGAVRNEGDDPLSRDELEGMARQVAETDTGVFPEHGTSSRIDPARYSQFERLGDWRGGEVVTRDGTDEALLMATARLADPETLPAATGSFRESLAILKEQAKRGIGINSSIGWRDAEGFPGGNDLMEASIVGIGADWRTNTTDEGAELVAQAAVDAGADPQTLLARVADAVTPDGERPLGPPDDPDRFEDFDACVDALSDDPDLSESDAERICGAWEQAKDQAADPPDGRAEYDVDGETIEITPPDAVVNAAEAALDAKAEFSDDIGDCGTGVGEERARQIIADEVGPEVIDEVAAYLDSHAEDVAGIDQPPTDWGRETWTDGCGPVQYALWGGTATGTGQEWAKDRANAVAEAKGEDIPYPEVQNDMTDSDNPDEGSEQDVQDAPEDGAEQTRAPGDIGEEDLAEFVSETYDGVDAADVIEAVNEVGGSFQGLSMDTLGWFMGDILDISAGEAQDLIEEMTEGEAEDGDEEQTTDEDGDEMDDDDAESDEEMAADAPDGEQDLREEIADLREQLAEVREGGVSEDDVDTPDADGDGQRDAADDEEDDADQRSDHELTDKYGIEHEA